MTSIGERWDPCDRDRARAPDRLRRIRLPGRADNHLVPELRGGHPQVTDEDDIAYGMHKGRWCEFDKNNPNREIRRAFGDDPTYLKPSEEILAGQRQTASRMADIAYALTAIFVEMLRTGRIEPDITMNGQRVKDWARIQREHIERYQRLPQRSDLPSWQRRLGGRLDRLCLVTADLATSLVDFSEQPARIRLRREAAEANEQRREERLFNRQLEREERETAEMAPPPVKASKREKRAASPRCERCKKRAQAVGTLCELCASWGGRR